MSNNSFWEILNTSAVGIQYSDDDEWVILARDENKLLPIGGIPYGLIPMIDELDITVIHMRPLTLRQQFEKSIYTFWKYIDPKYNWIAADEWGSGVFDWYLFSEEPFFEGGEQSVWIMGDSCECKPLFDFSFYVSPGLHSVDMKFERPFVEEEKRERFGDGFLDDLWPYLNSDFNWIAANRSLSGELTWYAYNQLPEHTGSDEYTGKWRSSVNSNCTHLEMVFIDVPLSVPWYQLIFRRKFSDTK